MKKFKNAVKYGAGVATSLIAAGAQAAIDLTSTTAALDEAATAVVTVGGACLVVVVAVKTFSFVKTALGR